MSCICQFPRALYIYKARPLITLHNTQLVCSSSATSNLLLQTTLFRFRNTSFYYTPYITLPQQTLTTAKMRYTSVTYLAFASLAAAQELTITTPSVPTAVPSAVESALPSVPDVGSIATSVAGDVTSGAGALPSAASSILEEASSVIQSISESVSSAIAEATSSALDAEASSSIAAAQSSLENALSTATDGAASTSIQEQLSSLSTAAAGATGTGDGDSPAPRVTGAVAVGALFGGAALLANL